VKVLKEILKSQCPVRLLYKRHRGEYFEEKRKEKGSLGSAVFHRHSMPPPSTPGKFFSIVSALVYFKYL
jgi:hypothetical protein